MSGDTAAAALAVYSCGYSYAAQTKRKRKLRVRVFLTSKISITLIVWLSHVRTLVH